MKWIEPSVESLIEAATAAGVELTDPSFPGARAPIKTLIFAG